MDLPSYFRGKLVLLSLFLFKFSFNLLEKMIQ